MYTNCDIPARIFFDIVSTNTYSLVGEGTPEEQKEAFYKIFDEYYLLDDNSHVGDLFKKQQKINLLAMQIPYLTACLNQIRYVEMSKEQIIKLIEAINKLEGLRFFFDVNKDILKELKRLESFIKSLRNRMNIEIGDQEKGSKAATITYNRELAQICIILGFYLKDDISLREYIEYRKIAKEKAKPKTTK